MVFKTREGCLNSLRFHPQITNLLHHSLIDCSSQQVNLIRPVMKFITLTVASFAAVSMATPALLPRANYCQFQCKSGESLSVQRLKEDAGLVDYRAGCQFTDRMFPLVLDKGIY